MAHADNRLGMRRARLAAITLLAMLGAGCGNFRPIPESERAANVGKPMEWVEADGKRDESRYKAAYDACYAQVYGYKDDNRSSDKGFDFRTCMRLKGWHEVPATK